MLLRRSQGDPLSRICEICGKRPWVGKQVSHSHRRSPRRWLPNIQRVRIRDGSNTRRVRVCTSCLKAGKAQKA
jgi:large subunit ribosomal protein L28